MTTGGRSATRSRASSCHSIDRSNPWCLRSWRSWTWPPRVANGKRSIRPSGVSGRWRPAGGSCSRRVRSGRLWSSSRIFSGSTPRARRSWILWSTASRPRACSCSSPTGPSISTPGRGRVITRNSGSIRYPPRPPRNSWTLVLATTPRFSPSSGPWSSGRRAIRSSWRRA